MSKVVNTIPTEAYESKMFMRYLRERKLPFTHIKNETGRAIAGRKVRNYRAMWGAMDGVSPGFPDFLIIAGGRLIAVEMKRIKNSNTSLKQLVWIDQLKKANVPAMVCKGATEAIEFVETFYDGTNDIIDKSKEAF